MKKRFVQAGFTLVELMVVISVISILASIIFVSVSIVREKAQVLKFSREIMEVRNAVALYREDHDGGWPTFNPFNPIPNYGPSMVGDLYAENLFGANHVDIPKGLLYDDSVVVGAGGKNSGDIGCGGPQNYLTAEYVIYFAWNSSELYEKYKNLFFEKYHGENLFQGYSCLELY